ncbi:MAG: ATP-grasp domain-containing protein [Gemmatimonadales bacterium]
MTTARANVLVVYNQVGEDVYEKIREIGAENIMLGFEPEYDVDVGTAQEEYEAVARALRTQGFKAQVFNMQDDLQRLERRLRRSPPDVIFNLVEIYQDNPILEAAIAGLFELLRIPFTGSGPFALTLCQRKGLTKQLLEANGVPTPRFRVLHEVRIPRRHGLHYPLIVKPAREDASSGISKESVVHDYNQLLERLVAMFAEFDPPILVEEFIEGRELHASIIGNEAPVVLPMIEYDFSNLPPDHPALISFDAKWNPLEEVFHQVHSICPAKLTDRVRRRVEKAALAAYKVTGVRDYARLDIRLDALDHPFVLEVNPNPDLTEGVSFMESAEWYGMSFEETLAFIVEMALDRAQGKFSALAPELEFAVPNVEPPAPEVQA